MPTDKALVDALRARLEDLEEEREAVLHMLRLYERGAVSAPPKRPAQARLRVAAAPAPAGDVGQSQLFEVREGGPTQRLMHVITQEPGLKYAEVLDRAQKGMETTADNPRRSLGSTLGTLVKRGKIARVDGQYYPPGWPD